MFIMNGRANGKGCSLYKASFYNPNNRVIELKTFRCKNMIELKRQLSILNQQGYEYDPYLIPFQRVNPEDWKEIYKKNLVKG